MTRVSITRGGLFPWWAHSTAPEHTQDVSMK